jgi:hypothetical protein
MVCLSERRDASEIEVITALFRLKSQFNEALKMSLKQKFAVFVALLSVALWMSGARAQVSGLSPDGINKVPHVGIYCVNSAGNDVLCVFPNGSAAAPPVGSSNWGATTSSVTSTTTTPLVAARTGGQGTGRIAVVVVNQGPAAGCIGPTSSVSFNGTVCTAGVMVPVGTSRTLITQASIYAATQSGSTTTMDATETY